MRHASALTAQRFGAVALIVGAGVAGCGGGSSRPATDQTRPQATTQSSTAAAPGGPATPLPRQATTQLLAADTALLNLQGAAEARAVRPLLKQYNAVQVAIAHEIPGTGAIAQNALEKQSILEQLDQVAPELIRHGDFAQPVGVDPTREAALLATGSTPNAPQSAAADVSTMMSVLENVTLKSVLAPIPGGGPVLTVGSTLEGAITALVACGLPGLASELKQFEDSLPPG
jgi:hypothetical protein